MKKKEEKKRYRKRKIRKKRKKKKNKRKKKDKKRKKGTTPKVEEGREALLRKKIDVLKKVVQGVGSSKDFQGRLKPLHRFHQQEGKKAANFGKEALIF